MMYEVLQGMDVKEALAKLAECGEDFSYVEETEHVTGTLKVSFYEFEVEDGVVLYGFYYL